MTTPRGTRRLGGALAASVLLAAAPGAGSASAGVELYRRVVPLETTTGVVSLREAVSVPLEVPDRCADGSLGCTTTRRFARLYRIDFAVELRRALDGERLVEREPRGTAYLALAATHEEEQSYDERLREALGSLAAAAFDEPYAGLRPDRQPFGGWVSARSVEPSWTCFGHAGARGITRYSRGVTVGDDGTETVSSTHTETLGDPALSAALCTALERATATAHPDELRTMSTPRRLREEILVVEVTDRLPGSAHADQLVELPEGAELGRRAAPGVERSFGISTSDETIRARVAIDEVETSARMMPAELPAAAARAHAWHSRWTLETIERRLGPLPVSRPIERWSLTASLLPTRPPRDLDATAEGILPQASGPYAVRLDPEALFTRVGQSLDFHAELTPDVLADRIVHRIAGLGSPGWILVICLPDDTATWGLPPTTGRPRLLNAGSFCDAVAGELP